MKFELRENKWFLSFLVIFLGFVGVGEALIDNVFLSIIYIVSLCFMFATEKAKGENERKKEELEKMQNDCLIMLQKIEEDQERCYEKRIGFKNS